MYITSFVVWTYDTDKWINDSILTLCVDWFGGYHSFLFWQICSVSIILIFEVSPKYAHYPFLFMWKGGDIIKMALKALAGPWGRLWNCNPSILEFQKIENSYITYICLNFTFIHVYSVNEHEIFPNLHSPSPFTTIIFAKIDII